MSTQERVFSLMARPVPLRTLAIRKLLRTWPTGSYRSRLYLGAVNRPHYGWCLYHAAEEAKALGYKAITVLEFGVAGGNGLICLCEHKRAIEKEMGVEVRVVGFDTGKGLPPSSDPRDLLYCWPPGSYEMDRPALEARIAGRAELVIGDVAQTVIGWEPAAHAPIGAIMFDLDFYSSTMAAFGILSQANTLPRIWCYFDDIRGYPENAYTDGIGEREAIRQFNLAPERKQLRDHLSPAYTFKAVPPEAWHEDIYLYHRLNHPNYNTCLTKEEKSQLRLAN
ncbi:hypothetical protein [Paracidobacterium acidisoli]|uniref:Uncharacterized protein n=1 Tax=Paracidobacterium acidisoli TaxID=2303751 RepID=A0A372IPK2_9BACT|nr:hypothetical protein [Paracidobacterium acidisoli]MBT9331145.1 hypothetical protein [Paracidobacterium acidisoli]